MNLILSIITNLILFTICFTISIVIVGAVYVKCRYRAFSSLNLKQRHVVITGGSSGIGKAIACYAVKKGANVTIMARDKKKLDEAKNEIKRYCVSQTQMDVSNNYDNIKKIFNDIELISGSVFMLVNCAGSAICGKLENTSETDIKKMFDLNCLGTIYPTKAVIEKMKDRREGYIVITASQAGQVGIFGYSAYSASKFALKGFAEALNMEVKPYNVKITVAYPPDTDTPGFEIEEKNKPKETKLISDTSGLYTPEEVANKIMKDTLAGYFNCSFGIEGFMMSILCVGMSPYASIFHLFLESCLMGTFRLVGAAYLISFDKIVKKCMNN